MHELDHADQESICPEIYFVGYVEGTLTPGVQYEVTYTLVMYPHNERGVYCRAHKSISKALISSPVDPGLVPEGLLDSAFGT